MWHQWSTSYHLGDAPITSAQHEYRFPTIIQLDEVGPPPPSSHKALLSPVTSSSQSYDYYSSSEEVEGVEDEEEEEEATESYCSSDLSGPRLGTGDPERASVTASAPVEQTVKMSRVLAWRNSFDSAFTEDNAAVLLSLKRKYSHEKEECENEEAGNQPGSGKSLDAASTSQASSRRSKRSRTASSSCSSSWSLPSPPPQVPSLPSERVRMYTCSACDASFLALEELQHHSGSDHEACRIAVEYGFE